MRGITKRQKGNAEMVDMLIILIVVMALQLHVYIKIFLLLCFNICSLLSVPQLRSFLKKEVAVQAYYLQI